MRLGLDTDVAVEVLRGRHPHYRSWIEAADAAGASLHMSSIVLHELSLGAFVSARPDLQLMRVEQLASSLEVVEWTAADAVAAAEVRARLQRAGKSIGGLDVLIAGQALNRRWLLVTNNRREFARVDGLTVLDWSDPSKAPDLSALAEPASERL